MRRRRSSRPVLAFLLVLGVAAYAVEGRRSTSRASYPAPRFEAALSVLFEAH